MIFKDLSSGVVTDGGISPSRSLLMTSLATLRAAILLSNPLLPGIAGTAV